MLLEKETYKHYVDILKGAYTKTYNFPFLSKNYLFNVNIKYKKQLKMRETW